MVGGHGEGYAVLAIESLYLGGAGIGGGGDCPAGLSHGGALCGGGVVERGLCGVKRGPVDIGGSDFLSHAMSLAWWRGEFLAR